MLVVLTCIELRIADDPAAWAALGFAVDGDVARVGQVDLRFVGSGAASDDARARGIVGWTLAGAAGPDTAGGAGGDVDGLPTLLAPAAATGDGESPVAPPPVEHPNGVVAIDHVVVLTPDLDRTTEALGAVGLEARRTREAGRGRLQRFFRLGEVILELVGPALPRDREQPNRPATFFGLALTSIDLDATVARLEGRIGAAKPAVQPGRRIATLRTSDDVSVPIAVMSPEPRRSAHGEARSGR